MTSEHGKYSKTGSILVQDSVFENVQNALRTHTVLGTTDSNSTGIAFDNVAFRNTKAAVIDKSSLIWIQGSVGSVDTYIVGGVYIQSNKYRDFQITDKHLNRPTGLLGDLGANLPKPIYLKKAKPQYATTPASQFVSMKRSGAKG
jgi:hypothetical protein